MKRATTTTIIALSILLVGLYTVTSTYSVIINVIEKNGITEIANKITIKDLLINDAGNYSDIYYMIKEELEVNDEEANLLMNSVPLNETLQTILQSIVDYKVNKKIDAKLTANQLYDLINKATLATDNISDDLKSRVINKSSYYRNDILDYIYDIEVSPLGDNL